MFGFEDGTLQNWQSYGRASAKVHDGQPTATDAGAATAFLPRTGSRMLTTTLGNGAGMRWPATKDAWLSGFQVRVWVRSRSRSGTLTLSVSGGQKNVSASAELAPGVWTPIVTPRTYMGGKGMPVVNLVQSNACEDGDIEAIDIDDTAIASSFDSEPAVWQADNADLLADPLPQLTLTTLPCRSSKSSSSTSPSSNPGVFDFENRKVGDWQGMGMTAVKVAKTAAINGMYGLRLTGQKQTTVSAEYTADLKAFGGSGSWYRLRMSVAGKPTVKIKGTCAPTKTVDATVSVSAYDVSDKTNGTFRVVADGSQIEYWFLPNKYSSAVTFSVTSPLQALSIDDVILDRGSAPSSTTTTAATSSSSTVLPANCGQPRS